MKNIHDFPEERILISPSMLAADFAKLGEEIKAAENAGAELLHLDVMDGHFVPNLSFAAPVIKSLRKHSNMLFDVHLMISDPARYAADFAKAGADHITFHVESDNQVQDAINAIKATGCTIGISVKPHTPAEAIFPYLEQIDMVLIMTVEPGFGGQSFMADQLPKIEQIKQEIKRRNLKCRIEVDGGIDAKTSPLVKKAGADTLVAGTAFFRHPDGMQKAAELLR